MTGGLYSNCWLEVSFLRKVQDKQRNVYAGLIISGYLLLCDKDHRRRGGHCCCNLLIFTGRYCMVYRKPLNCENIAVTCSY